MTSNTPNENGTAPTLAEPLTIDIIGNRIVARDESGNVVAERKRYCNPAALAQLIYDAEQIGMIDWSNSQVAQPAS